MSIVRYYNLGAGFMEITAQSTIQAECLTGVVGPSVPLNGDICYRLDIVTAAEIAPPAGAVEIETTRFEDIETLTTYVLGNQHWIVSDAGSMLCYEPGSTVAVLTVREGAVSVSGSPVMLALDEATCATGQSILHAACLRPPETSGVVLIFAQSGTGKTTTSLALAKAGFYLATDDASVLQPRADGTVAAWGYSRNLNVHKQTAAMLPWIAPLMGEKWGRSGEQNLSLDKLSAYVALDRLNLCDVAAVIYLSRDAELDAPVMAPMEKSETLTMMIADNVRVGPNGLTPTQMARLDAITLLVSTTPCFELKTAQGLDGVPEAVLLGLAEV